MHKCEQFRTDGGRTNPLLFLAGDNSGTAFKFMQDDGRRMVPANFAYRHPMPMSFLTLLNSQDRESPMKLNVRKAIWMFDLAVAVTAFVTPKLAAYQSPEGQNNRKTDSRDNANNLMYQQGLDHGQADRTNNQSHQYRLQPNDSDDRRAYESGYDQGYQNGHDADRETSARDGQPESTDNLATRNGVQDGANDGLQDRQSGHSSRATQHQAYEHGDRGYERSLGSKDKFKASYRQAYIQGYEKGYSGQKSDNR